VSEQKQVGGQEVQETGFHVQRSMNEKDKDVVNEVHGFGYYIVQVWRALRAANIR